MCIERLSHLICREVEEGTWRPMMAGRNGPRISHLMFADDLLLFAESSVDQIENLIQVLGVFCSASGQRVSNAKTSIFFLKKYSFECAY